MKVDKLILFISLTTISIICFTFASWVLYLGLLQPDIPMQLFAMILFGFFICLGIIFIIVIFTFPPDFEIKTFQKISDKNVNWIFFLRQSIQWLIFVMILLIVTYSLALIGKKFFPQSIDYLKFFEILVLYFVIAMIVSYSPVFEKIKEFVLHAL